MVYNPSGRTTRYFAGWAAASAVVAVLMALLALASDAARVFGLIAAVLFAGLAVANLVAIAKLRGVSG